VSVIRPRPSDLDEHLPAIVAGNERVFAVWLAGAEPRVRASLASFAARVDVEAVLQEALLRVWLTARRVVPDGRENSLLRMAVRIGRNLAVSELRRARVEPMAGAEIERAAEAYDIDALGGPPARDPLLARRIQDCLRQLPRQPSRALNASLEGGGLEPDEILAEGLRMRKNTFLQNITRARKLIAECLARHGVDLALELI
jgi:RNA polymerase sigma-70 factor (ECF subfamily)